MKVVLGIDQSLTSTGVVVIRHTVDKNEVLYHASLQTEPTGLSDYADVLHRANSIADRIVNIVDMYKVTDIAIEGLSFGSKGNATRNLAMLFAIICNKLNITEPYTVPPTTLKKFATGNGRADKKEVLESVKLHDVDLHSELSRLTIKAGKYDLADAYFLALHKLGV